MSTRSIALVPSNGWDSFSRSADLEELVWEALAHWHYMAPTSNSSIWESDSGATFYLAFGEDRRIVEAVAGHVAEADSDLDDLCARLQRTYGVRISEPRSSS